jgi:hypothetical protein
VYFTGIIVKLREKLREFSFRISSVPVEIRKENSACMSKTLPLLKHLLKKWSVINNGDARKMAKNAFD